MILSRACVFLLCSFAVEAVIGPDFKCGIFVVTPFTTDNGSSPAVGLNRIQETNIGHSQMAAAVMAILHFNNRDTSVVPELDSLRDCNVRFDIDRSFIFDSGLDPYAAAQALYKKSIGEKPCAIVGPFSDSIAKQLGVLALAGEYPHVVTRAYSLDVTSNSIYPFTSTVFPDLLSSADNVAEYLNWNGRTDYVAIVYDLGSVGPQRFEALSVQLRLRNIGHMGFSFAEDSPEIGLDVNIFGPLKALEQVRARGFRTVVFCLEDPRSSLQPVADAIVELGMDDGQYVFVFFDLFEPALYDEQRNDNVTSFVKGAAWIIPDDYAPNSAFLESWRNLSVEAVDILNAINPIDENAIGYIETTDNFFQSVDPEYGAGYMYDAVMAIGFGACLASSSPNILATGNASSPSHSISSFEHQEGIRLSNFTGVTGAVGFGGLTGDREGARQEGSVTWLSVNFVDESEGFFEFPHIRTPGEDWEELDGVDFIYRDGSDDPPPLLRAPPNQNYLSSGLRAFGFTLMSISFAFSLLCALWLFICRDHRIVKAAQPPFLYVICCGTIIQASSIVTISYDESYGWSQDQLNRACMAMPWLMSLGFILVYTSLFSKLWRVNKVLQFTRKKVTMWHVAWPTFLLLFGALVILALWTCIDPLRWERDEINQITGENVGTCESDFVEPFVGPLVLVMLIPAVLTGFMAYQTKDIDESFAESWYIVMLITIHVQIIFVSTPVVIVLNDVSTSGRYLGFVLMMWSFPVSTLGFIFVPKMVRHFYNVKGWDKSSIKRGERGNGRVTGLEESSTGRTNSASVMATSFGTNTGGSRWAIHGIGSSRKASSADSNNGVAKSGILASKADGSI